ncbi:hypothetical protein H0H93_003142 [Arthromyces matolae]|nr:hypothetical protein H0H93_003142 [Arthromyces matolae]
MATPATQDIPCATNSRTLYTPVFYATPSSSSSRLDASQPIPKAYLERMSKRHIALACKVEEVPSSRPGSPTTEDLAGARVDALRQRVKEALDYAHADPSDGKWSAVVRLLKLRATQKRRWLNTTTEGKPAESSLGWINATTEEEWEDWEVKWKEEDRVKKKVETWQKDLEEVAQVAQAAPSIVSISQQKELQRVPTLQDVTAKDKKTQSTLAFSVVKRSSTKLVGHKSKGSMKASASYAAGKPSNSSLKPLPRVDEPPIESSSPGQEPRPIQDLSESSFLPPSFPSQLDTSTPNNQTQKRHKPQPIVLAPPSSSPLPTPPSMRVYGRQKTLSTLPSELELDVTPTRPSRQPSTLSEMQREKRARSMTPPHAVKKAKLQEERSLSTPEHPVSVVAPITPVVTPKRAQLPRLTDLIASSKKAKASTSKRKEKTANNSLDATPARDSELSLGSEQKTPSKELTDSKDEAEKVQPSVTELEIEAPAERAEAEAEAEAEMEPTEEEIIPAVFQDYIAPLADDDDDNRSSSYKLIASPARSLSSLAASDSDSEADDDNDVGDGAEKFDPPFTSTQAEGKAKAAGWLGYNSQFDVDKNVDLVSKFMEKDVDVDFAGWLRTPSVEPAGEPESSQ